MPKEKKSKTIDDLRHNEYYGMQEIFDSLYAKSKEGQVFPKLMDLILKDENILLAYRNIKSNNWSKATGTDGFNISDISKLSPTEVINKVKFIMVGSQHGYRPKPVRRKEIPRTSGETRPIGIPCIWDRLIQQCIKQVLEPICEAKFSDNSFGFRPIKSAEHAIARTYRMIQMSNLYHVIELDINNFFDNVDHKKLIKQMWAFGIQDKKLIWLIKTMLKSPVRMDDGSIVNLTKGTPQAGIISPLLANIVLNELDKWIESQWQENPVTLNYSCRLLSNGTRDRSHGYRAMRESTDLKEMWIVRYADNIRIFCRNKEDAEKVLIATTKWLRERLNLDVSQEKTKIIDVRHKYVEFLGFKIKARWSSQKGKYVIYSHISDKALKEKTNKLVNQIKKVCSNRGLDKEVANITLYNSMVLGIQNYYRIATNVASDLNHAQQLTYHIMYNRLDTQTGNRLSKKGRKLTNLEQKRFGSSKSLRYIKGTDEPVYPIYYIQFKNPIAFNRRACVYTQEGRKVVHDNLAEYLPLLYQIRDTKPYNYSLEMYDNRIALYCAQRGKCYVMNKVFESISEIHCHHKVPKSLGGSDEYDNLVLIHEDIHRLIHSTNKETILLYLEKLKPNATQLEKINYLRCKLKKSIIKKYNLEEHTLILENVDD